MADPRRALPKVDVLARDPRLAAIPADLRTELCREVIDRARARIDEGLGDLGADVASMAADLLGGRVRKVINATGVIVHTNLGRAPWAPEAVSAATQAMGYCAVEMDLPLGERGGRGEGVENLLRRLVGAEAACVVNNGAAAVLLALTALARDREVIVSRGELVEIGGGFRVPDVISAGGARLVEVGTTNRTRSADYGRAITASTAALLRVHRSNFKIIGFVEEPSRAELVALAAEHGLLVVEDQGSGALEGPETTIREVIAAGVDVVLFSGDKLLGGPQAGLCVGKGAVIDRMRRHPLFRALRADKVTLAALEATLALHLSGSGTPVQRMLHTSESELAVRADALVERLRAEGIAATRQSADGFTGGGARPGEPLRSACAVLEVPRVEAFARVLRLGAPPIVARVEGGRLWLDVRTVDPAEAAILADRVASAFRNGY